MSDWIDTGAEERRFSEDTDGGRWYRGETPWGGAVEDLPGVGARPLVEAPPLSEPSARGPNWTPWLVAGGVIAGLFGLGALAYNLK